MTHRVYALRPKQQVAHKTTTERESVAAFAFSELQGMDEGELGRDAVGITWTENGKQKRYVDLTKMEKDKGGGQP